MKLNIAKSAPLESIQFEEALTALRSPAWLVSNHGDIECKCHFSKEHQLVFSFNITFPDGSCLAESRYAWLRKECYDYLCAVGQDGDGGRARSPERLKKNIVQGVNLLDYFFLNHWAKLTRHGFKSITGQDLIILIRKVASSKETVDVLCNWKSILVEYLKESGKQITPTMLARAVKDAPYVAELPLEPELTELSRTQLLLARAALFQQGFYTKRHHGDARVNSEKLSTLLLKNTLTASMLRFRKSRINDLAAGMNNGGRELVGVPTRTGYGDGRCSQQSLNEFRNTLTAWQHLCVYGEGIPNHSLSEAARYDPSQSTSFKASGHTNPLPVQAVLYSLNEAIAIFYKHCSHVFNSLSEVLIAAHRNNEKIQRFCNSTDISKFLHKETLALGISKWSIVEYGDNLKGYSRPVDFYNRIRNNDIGLIEMTKIINGATYEIIGLMSAARSGEIVDLTSESIDESKSWIELSSRKSGYGSMRKKHWRPIPEVVSQIFEEYGKFHDKLNAAGIKTSNEIFSTVSYIGEIGLSANSLYNCLDLFCDYICMPIDNEGRRYYIRPHQLRQFFIVAFFYASGVSGVETLRWFVRHFDPEHLWAYLRQNISGATMMRHKSVALKGLVRDNSEQVYGLTEFLTKKLGVKRFDVMTDSELVEYLTELQEEGKVEVEPVFYEDAAGFKWRLGVKIFGD